MSVLHARRRVKLGLKGVATLYMYRPETLRVIRLYVCVARNDVSVVGSLHGTSVYAACVLIGTDFWFDVSQFDFGCPTHSPAPSFHQRSLWRGHPRKRIRLPVSL